MYGVIRRWCVVGTIVLYSLLTASQAADCENGVVSSGPCNSEGRCNGPYRCNSQNVCCPVRLNTGPTCSGGAPSKGPCDSKGSCTGPYTCNDQNLCCPMRLNAVLCEDGMPSNGQCDSEGNCQGPYQCSGQNLCCPVRFNSGSCDDGGISSGPCDSEGSCKGPFTCNSQNMCCPVRINTGSCDDGGISSGPCDSEGSCKGPFSCNSQNMCCPVRINTGSCDDGGISSGPCDIEGNCKGPFSCNSQNMCCPVRIHTGSCQNGAMSSGQCDVEGKCQGPYTCNSQNMCCPFRFNTDDCDDQMPSVGPCDTEGKCSGPYICNARNKCCPIKVNTGDCDDSMPSSGSCDSEQRCSGPYYCNGKNKCCPVKLNTGDCGPGMSRGLCDSEGRCSGPYYCSSSNKCCPVKVNKDMMCPPVTPGMMGTCVEECSTNSQCPKGTMCCSNGCGHTCQVPVSRMRGKCPSYNKDTVGICVGNGAGGKKCSGDMDCKNGDLCCNNGCGPVCTPADTKTPCQRELAMAMIQMRTSLDSCSPIFIPRCDRKGNYHRTQCYDNNGVCFCVNPNGTKIAGTEVRGNPDCSKATKPGTCPAIVSVSKSDLICSSTCQSDDDCIGSDKCCTNGCAYHCSPAVFKDDGLSGTRKKRHVGDDVCANGMTAAGPCDGEGACNGPYMCDSHKNLCCPIQINVVHTCSDGTSTMTSCDSEGGCPSGTTCEDKFCCPPKTTGAFCIYKPYIDTTVTYVGVVGSIKMASAEACKAACDKDTLADCIGVVYQKDKGGRCAKYTDQTHVTKTPLKGSVYYERLCQFSAGLCRNQSSVLMSDGVPKTCNHDNDCGVQSFGCEGGHCCPRLNQPPTIPPTVLCKSGGIVIKDTNGLVKSCSPSTPCGAGEECEDSVCCPKAILQGLCPGNGEVLMEDGSPKTCMTDQECGAVGYKCQGQLGSKYCCPGSSAQVVCPNGGIPQKMNNLPKSCTSDTQCGPSYTCKGNPGSKHCCPTKLYKLDVCPNNGMVFISDGRPKRCTVNADCLGGIGVYTCVDNYCCPQKVNQNMCPHNGRVLKINGHPRTCTADIECQGSRQGSFSCQQGYCCPRSNICPDGKEPKCCDIKLCLYHACPLAPRAACRINPCGGCKVEFYDRFNNIVNCTAGLTKCQEKQQKTVEVSMMWVDTTGYTSVETDGLVQQISNEGLDDQDTTVVPKPLDSKPGQCPGGDLHDTGITSTSPCTTDSECAGDKKCCYNGNNTYCRLPVIVPMTKGHCEKPPVVGLCEGYFIRYFFNSTSRKCEQFVYGGCHGNENNFQTLEACQRGCIEGTPQECLESPDRGQCKAYIPMFFYNVNSGKCEKFIYGGCQGNSNKFTTLQQCYATCISSWNPSHPCARTRCPGNTKCVAKDDKQAECVPKGTLPNGAGVHMPDCMADGRYAPVQCQGALCWCVHNSGKMIPGSITLGRPQCNIGGPLVGPTQPSTTVACPDGSLPQICDSCLTARCGGRPAVKCLADPCNNCAVKFVDKSGSAVNCGDKCNGVKPAGIQGISDLECGNRKKVWYYNKITQTCQETFVCTHHASSPSVYASKLECQSECTASVCGGSGPMTCTTTCNNLSCKRFPSAVCRVNPCTCNTEFYDPVTNLQVNCDVVTPICQIQRAQMMLSVTPSKLKQDVTEYVCNVRGEFLPQQCDRAKHCWCVDGLGKMTSQKKITVRNIAQSIGCKENKTKSAVLSVTYNVDYDSVIKGKESSFKRAFMQRLQEITPEIRQYVQKILLRRGSVIVDVVLITPDSDAEVKDVGAFVNLLSSEISKGLAVTFDGKLLVSETAVNSRLSFEQEPESQKAPVTDTEDRKTVLIVVLTVVLSAVLITAVIVICLVKRRGGKFSSLEEGKESPRLSNDMYFHNAACEKK